MLDGPLQFLRLLSRFAIQPLEFLNLIAVLVRHVPLVTLRMGTFLNDNIPEFRLQKKR